MKQNETEKTQGKILVVEDQSATLEELSLAIREAMLGEVIESRFSDCPEQELGERGIVVARDYNHAQEAIENDSYDFVFLDHRIPREYDPEIEGDKDILVYSETLEDIGYSLIPRIRGKNGQTTIIGTSSCSQQKLMRFEKPDFRLEKAWGNATKDLKGILNRIKCEESDRDERREE